MLRSPAVKRLVVRPEDVDKEALHEVCSNNCDRELSGHASTRGVCAALYIPAQGHTRYELRVLQCLKQHSLGMRRGTLAPCAGALLRLRCP